MDNSASFPDYENPPNSPISDVLNLCNETTQFFDFEEIVGTPYPTLIDPDTVFANNLESAIQGSEEPNFDLDENTGISQPVDDSEFGALIKNFMNQVQEHEPVDDLVMPENFMNQGQEHEPVDDLVMPENFMNQGQEHEPVDDLVMPDEVLDGFLLNDALDDLSIEASRDDNSVNPSVSDDGTGENLNDNSVNPSVSDDGTGENLNDIPKPLSVWPPQPIPFSCSFCQILRVIFHSNGIYTTKLEIHGRVGMICHGILEMRHENVSENPLVLQQMIDFCLRSPEDVKHYLTQYCEERKEAGFVMSQDPLSTYYSAICVGIDSDEYTYTSDDNAATGLGTHPASDRNVIQFPAVSLSAQRARTKKLKMSDLVDYFHLPIESAAKRLAICPTAIKKICRKGGLSRWPHRKIKSIERKLHKLESTLRNKNAQDTPDVRAKIVKLTQERDRFLHGMTM